MTLVLRRPRRKIRVSALGLRGASAEVIAGMIHRHVPAERITRIIPCRRPQTAAECDYTIWYLRAGAGLCITVGFVAMAFLLSLAWRALEELLAGPPGPLGEMEKVFPKIVLLALAAQGFVIWGGLLQPSRQMLRQIRLFRHRRDELTAERQCRAAM